MPERTPPVVRNVLTGLPDRPLSIWEYNTLTMDVEASLPSQLFRPIYDLRESVPTDQVAYTGDVVCKQTSWTTTQTGIIGFRFQTDQTWVSVGFEADTGWTILHTDPVGKKGLGVIGDRIASWAETFYEDLKIKRIHPLQGCLGAAVALLPSEPITEDTLTSIFSDGGGIEGFSSKEAGLVEWNVLESPAVS